MDEFLTKLTQNNKGGGFWTNSDLKQVNWRNKLSLVRKMGERLARGFFSTHDTYAYKSISSYYSYKPWMTMPQINREKHKLAFRFSQIHWIGLSDAIKLFLSSSLYEQHDRDTYQRSLSSMKIISIDMTFVTMNCMILLPGIYLTRSWLATSTTCKYKFITIRWNSLIF